MHVFVLSFVAGAMVSSSALFVGNKYARLFLAMGGLWVGMAASHLGASS